MNSAFLPHTINPSRLAKTQAHLEGRKPLKDLPRLQDFMHDVAAEVAFELDFHADKKGRVYIQGRIETMLKLMCQRCLEPMEYVLDVAFKLIPVLTDKAADSLPDEYEALLLDEEGNVELSTLLEDEILLALPLVAKHEAC